MHFGFKFRNNIAGLYTEEERYDEAIKYYLKAVAIYKKLYGGRHPKIAIFYNNMGQTYKDQGDYAKAKAYFLDAIAIYQEKKISMHPNLATFYDNLAGIDELQEQYTDAMVHYQKALHIRQAAFGEEHEDTQYIKEEIDSLKKRIKKGS